MSFLFSAIFTFLAFYRWHAATLICFGAYFLYERCPVTHRFPPLLSMINGVLMGERCPIILFLWLLDVRGSTGFGFLPCSTRCQPFGVALTLLDVHSAWFLLRRDYIGQCLEVSICLVNFSHLFSSELVLGLSLSGFTTLPFGVIWTGVVSYNTRRPVTHYSPLTLDICGKTVCLHHSLLVLAFISIEHLRCTTLAWAVFSSFTRLPSHQTL